MANATNKPGANGNGNGHEPAGEELVSRLENYVASSGFPSHYVDVGGGRKAHYIVGGNGPAVVLLHGLGGSSVGWAPQIRALKSQYRVYAPDLLGFGLSDKPKGPYTLDDYARFLTGFLDAHSIQDAVIVGHSLGGLMALMLAEQTRERVRKLVLMDAAGLGHDLALPLRVSAAMGPWISADKAAVRRILRSIVYDPTFVDEDSVDFYYGLSRLPGARSGFMEALKLGVSAFNGQKIVLTELLPLLRMPTLLVWGANDGVIPVAHGRHAYRLIPDAQLHVIDKCGHWPAMEHADEFNTVLDRFLRGNEALVDLTKPAGRRSASMSALVQGVWPTAAVEHEALSGSGYGEAHQIEHHTEHGVAHHNGQTAAKDAAKKSTNDHETKTDKGAKPGAGQGAVQ